MTKLKVYVDLYTVFLNYVLESTLQRATIHYFVVGISELKGTQCKANLSHFVYMLIVAFSR